jgi:kynurenine formamidase
MCDIHIIESVKDKMLSRRSLLKKGIAATAALPFVPIAAGETSKKKDSYAEKTLNDLTHTLYEKFPTFFGEQWFFKKELFNYEEHKFNLFELRVNEHTGTHLDAPLHFSKNGHSVDEIPVSHLMAPLCIIDIKARAADNPNAEVLPKDIKAWVSKYGDIPNGACVAMNSGWDRYVNSAKFRNADSDGKLHFPGFHAEASAMLLETGAVGIAVDTLSLDYGASQDFAVHYNWLPQNRWGLECVANLDSLPLQGATIIVGTLKHQGGTGGPSRVFALV